MKKEICKCGHRKEEHNDNLFCRRKNWVRKECKCVHFTLKRKWFM